MLRIAVILSLVVASLAINLDLNDAWRLFKLKFDKQYQVHEEIIRREIWEARLSAINMHNLEADLGEHTYLLGINQFSDWDHMEFVEYMNGYKMSDKVPTNVYSAGLTAPPPSVDWRPKGYVTPIKNQEQCGSCWAFSATGSLEGQHFNSTGKLVSLSEQNLVDCSNKEGNLGCDGGLMDYAFEYIIKNKGIDTEVCYPYKARDEKCKYKTTCIGATEKTYTDVKSKDEDALQSAVATVGPISVAIDASHESFQSYKSGIYNEKACSQTMLDHGVLAVGYSAQGSDDYWIVKNSWGTSWGMKGYIWMSRNKNNQCGIATAASFPLV